MEREIILKILKKRCKNQTEGYPVSMIEKLHKDSIIEVGSSSVIAEMGLPQGSVLSPVLFNVYLEEALGSSELLKKVRSRGDLLAFADDMLIMSNEQ